ncbi:MAG TPA: hypothetical protein PK733_12470 [Clostridiales bacterium]|nr:hypothetical protein [Clostridiales bacterium]
MPSKALIYGITLVMLAAVLVFMVEIFLPLSAKNEFDGICRGTIMQMEVRGGLTNTTRDNLLNALRDKGFSNLKVQGTDNARYGEEIFLKVEGDYIYSRLIGLFTRRYIVKHIVYDRVTIARKVVN